MTRPGVMEIENLIRYAPRAVGLMEIENLFRYTERAVGLKPSAIQGKARLRGLQWIIYSKTITPRVIALLSAISCRSGRMLV